MLAAIRQTIATPLDLVVHGWPSLGAIRRHQHCPVFAHCCAPVYFKQELFEKPEEQARNCERIEEICAVSSYDLIGSTSQPDDLRIPMVDTTAGA